MHDQFSPLHRLGRAFLSLVLCVSFLVLPLPASLEGVTPSEPAAVQDASPTSIPTAEPTSVPTAEPTSVPTAEPTSVPTAEPTSVPTTEPTSVPTTEPTSVPTAEPTSVPTTEPTSVPTTEPTSVPTAEPLVPVSENPQFLQGYVLTLQTAALYEDDAQNALTASFGKNVVLYASNRVHAGSSRDLIEAAALTRDGLISGYIPSRQVRALTQAEYEAYLTDAQSVSNDDIAFYNGNEKLPLIKVSYTPAIQPTEEPAAVPTAEPTAVPTAEPTAVPTAEPTAVPTAEPTAVPLSLIHI